MSQSTVTSVLGEGGAVVVDGPAPTPTAPPVVDTVTATPVYYTQLTLPTIA